MQTPCQVHEDKRPIASIWWDDEDGSHWVVGQGGCTAIVAYGEAGEHCFISWLAIYKGDHLAARVSAHRVHIVYADPMPEAA